MRIECSNFQIAVTAIACLFALGCQSPEPVSTSTPIVAISPAATPALEVSKDKVLTVQAEGESREFSRDELLSHPQAVDLTLTDSAAHTGETITFRAVPMPAIFAGLDFPRGATLEFDSLDGFSASLDPSQVMNTDPKKATAYLAIEDPAKPWPKLKDGVSTAGPLYLVWKNPEASGIGQEQWPFQLRSFSIKESLESRFPGLSPDSKVAQNDPVYRGYQSFLKNCFSCHTLNGEGTSRMGPDLNEPHSPTEYLKEEYLRKLVRDPQSLRTWKASRMSSFTLEMLPEAELNDLIAYLRHKATQRATQKT